MKNDNISDDISNRKAHYEELVKLMPLKDKVIWAKKKIKEFLKDCEKEKNIDEITISFSGGKDSTVLLDLVCQVHHEIKCKIPLVMVYATEITFPSTIKFINDINKVYMDKYPGELKHIQMVKPKKGWDEILSQNGYPIYSKQISTILNRVKKAKSKNMLTKWFFGIDKDKTSTARYNLSFNRLFLLDDMMLNNWSKIIRTKEMKEYFVKYNEPYFFSEKCCDFIKGNLKHDKRPSFIGTMAEESQMRRRSWINYGCNIFNAKVKKSRPLSIWTKNDIWNYLKQNKIMINPAYGFDAKKDIDKQDLKFDRLGCTSCPYGSSIEQRLVEMRKKIDPKDNSFKTLNRFEVLYKEYPNIYKVQVIKNGMYKILIDMGIKINDDKLYMQLFEARQKQIKDWYKKENLKINIIRTMVQIENYKNWKETKKGEWTYSKTEFEQAMKHFDDIEEKNINMPEINQLRKEFLKSKKINKNH